MLLHIPEVLNAEQVAHALRSLDSVQWVDGRITAGHQSATAKYNLQVPEDHPVAAELGEIHKSLVKAHDNALEEYRSASRERHALLGKMLPHWRRIRETLNVVNKNVESLLERSRTIDRHIADYEEMVRGTDRAVQVLSSSSVVQFFVSALVLAVAVGGLCGRLLRRVPQSPKSIDA